MTTNIFRMTFFVFFGFKIYATTGDKNPLLHTSSFVQEPSTLNDSQDNQAQVEQEHFEVYMNEFNSLFYTFEKL